jgi:hypothetical protein
MINVAKTALLNKLKTEISGSHGDEHEDDDSLLEYGVV